MTKKSTVFRSRIGPVFRDRDRKLFPSSLDSLAPGSRDLVVPSVVDTKYHQNRCLRYNLTSDTVSSV